MDALESRLLLSSEHDVTLAFTMDGPADSMALQADGKILIGRWGTTEATLTRYFPDGTVDAGFGVNGTAHMPVASPDHSFSRVKKIVLQPDGKILLAGLENASGFVVDTVVRRLLPDGSPDLGYGTNGLVQLDLDPYVYAQCSIAGGSLLADGSFVFAGVAASLRSQYVLTSTSIVKLDPAGQIVFRTDMMDLAGQDLTVRSDGSFQLVGEEFVFYGDQRQPEIMGHFDYMARLIAPDGVPAPGGTRFNFLETYEPDGHVIDSNDYLYASAVQVVGGAERVVLAGSAGYMAGQTYFAMTRLNADLSVDTTFGRDGQALLYLTGADAIQDVLALEDGRLLVIGTTDRGHVAALFTPNGFLDTSFGRGGIDLYRPTAPIAGAVARGVVRGPIAPGSWLPDADPGTGTVPIADGDGVYDANVDEVPPAVALVGGPLANVSAAGGTSYDVTVRITDPRGVYRNTLGNGDLQLVTPSGARIGGVLQTTIDMTGRDPEQLTLTYRFTPPGGAWDSADNGTYWVAVGTDQIEDASANVVPASAAAPGLGQFTVAITPPDNAAPTASIAGATLPAVTVSGSSLGDFTVTYTDNVAVDVDSFDASDVRVVRVLGGGAVSAPVGTVSLLARSHASNGSPRTATYRLAKSFTASDNGTYRVQLVGSQVRDWAGNYAAASPGDHGLASFTVNVSAAARSAFSPIPATSFNAQHGTVVSGDTVQYIEQGDWLAYNSIDFGATGAQSVTINLAVLNSFAGKGIQVRLGGPTGTVIGTLTTTGTGSWSNYTAQTVAVTAVAGVQDVYLTFQGASYIANLQSFSFTAAAATRSAYSQIDATTYSSQSGTALWGGTVQLIEQGDWLAYRGIDFGAGGPRTFQLNLAVLNSFAGKRIRVRVGGTSGTVIGTLTTAGTGGWATYATQSISVSGVTGVQDLYLTFEGASYIANLAWFRFLA